MAGKKRKKKAKPAQGGRAASGPGLEELCKANRNRILLVAILLNLLLCLVLFDPKLHTGGDNASYVLLAESIVRTGDGYSQNISPGHGYPTPETQYLFGYPLLLVPLVALFGRNILVLKGFSVLLSLGTVLVSALVMRRLLRPHVWALFVLVVAVNPVIVEFSHWILSEMAFTFFSIFAFYLLQSAERRGENSRRRFLPGILLLVLAYYIRAAGAVLIVAMAVYLLLRKSYSRLLVFVAVAAILIAPWMIRNRVVGAGGPGYVSSSLMKNPYSPEQGMMGLADFPLRVIENLKIYSLSEVPRILLDGFALAHRGPLVWAVGAAVTLLMLTGLIYNLVKHRRLVEIYTFLYTGMLLVRPDVWSDVRFLMPLVPFLLYYTAEGVRLAAEKAGAAAGSAAGLQAAVLAVLLLAGAGVQAGSIPGNLGLLKQYMAGDRFAGYPANWRHLFMAGDWIRDNTEENDLVVVRKPRLFHLYTGRPVDGYPFTTDTDSVLARITSADYVVVDAVSGTTFRYLVPAIRKQPGRFNGVFSLENPITMILKVKR